MHSAIEISKRNEETSNYLGIKTPSEVAFREALVIALAAIEEAPHSKHCTGHYKDDEWILCYCWKATALSKINALLDGLVDA